MLPYTLHTVGRDGLPGVSVVIHVSFSIFGLSLFRGPGGAVGFSFVSDISYGASERAAVSTGGRICRPGRA